MNVFVSWRGSDREIKDKIVANLREGLGSETEIWESDMGCTSDFSADCIEAIRRSQVFVLILSDAAMEPSYVLNELLEARNLEMQGKLNIVMFKITDSPLTPSFAANLNHISDANHVGRMNHDDSGINTLVVRVKTLLEKRKNNNPEKSFDVFKPEIEGLPLCAPGFFVENSRDDVFECFDEAFSKSNIIFANKMAGYGRKSAVFKYAKLHSNEYEDIKVLRFFSGSLRRFITDGIEIKNINQDLFNDMNEEKIITKVVELLSKLDEKTLLIVPDVVIEDSDDQTILDAIAGIGCRVVFIVQSIPVRVSAKFPVVSVGRMKNESLDRIFFEYFDGTTEEEKDNLIPYLHSFFDRIDGHTKTVELTAVTLSNEIGVYAEDVPAILEKICKDEGDELSNRLSHLIADLFDTASFSASEKKIINIASLVAVIPIDEKAFVDILKKCDAYDAAAVKRLIELRWLDNDKENRTISMDSFLSSVYETKELADDEILAKCISFCDDAITEMLGSLMVGIKVSLLAQRLARLLKVGRAPEFGKFFMEAFSSDGLETLSREYIETKLNEITSEVAAVENEALSEAMASVMIIVKSIAYSNKTLTDSDFGDKEGSLLASAGIDSFVSHMKDIDIDYEDIYSERAFSELPDKFKELAKAVLTKNPQKLVNIYTSLEKSELEAYKAWKEDPENENSFSYVAVALFLEEMSQILITNYITLPKVCAEICRTRIMWAKLIGKFVSSYEAVFVYYWYACSLISILADAETILAVLSEGFDYVDVLKKEKNFSREEKDRIITVYIYKYVSFSASLKDSERVNAWLDTVTGYKSDDPETVDNLMDTLETISDFILGNATIEDWKVFYKKIDINFYKNFAATEKDENRSRKLLDFVGKFEEIALLLDFEEKKGIAVSDDMVYKNYYDTFAKSVTKKGLIKKYMDAAEKAMSYDFSGLSDEELAAMADELRATGCELKNILSVAPKALALMSEAVARTQGFRLHYVQYIGAFAIAEGNISEMQNGEGKTVTIAAAAFLLSLTGKQVHVLDESQYLAQRNYRWMFDTFRMLNCRIATIQKAESDLSPEIKNCEILYFSIKEAIFTEMTQNTRRWTEGRGRREILIVDEADQVLISSGTQEYANVKTDANQSALYEQIADLCMSIKDNKEKYYSMDARKYIYLTDAMYELAEKKIVIDGSESTYSFRQNLQLLLIECIRAFYVYEKGVDYFIDGDKIVREDTYKGVFEGFKKSFDYFLRYKERLHIDTGYYYKTVTADSYTSMEFVKQYSFICGASATVRSMTREFKEIYGLDIVSIPTEKPVVRVDHEPIVFTLESAKLESIVSVIEEKYEKKQPVLVVTGSVIESEKIAALLEKKHIKHVVLNAKNQKDEARILSEAGMLGAVTVSTSMANRGVDIRLGGNAEEMAKQRVLEKGYSLEEFESMYSCNDMREIAAVRIEYLKALKYYRFITRSQKEEVESLGGLCVIGTECFDDLRTEQQMRGRAGRQGSVGESHLFYCFSDPFIARMLNPAIRKQYEESFGDTGVSSGLITKMLSRAREKAQFLTYKSLLDSPSINYYMGAREKTIGVKEKLFIDCDYALFFVRKYLFEDKEVVSLAADYLKGKTDICPVKWAREYMDEHKGKYKDKEISQMLERVWMEYLSTYGKPLDELMKLLSEIISGDIVLAWLDYLEAMRQRISALNTETTMKDGAKKKLIEDYSEELILSSLKRIASSTAGYMTRIVFRDKE